MQQAWIEVTIFIVINMCLSFRCCQRLVRMYSILVFTILFASMPSMSMSVVGGSSITSTMLSPPIVYTIAGSDSGGGAGIQADLHAIHAFGCHGCSAITCLTAQNSVGVTDVHTPPTEFLQKQLTTLEKDLPPTAIKIGMLGSVELAKTVGQFLQRIRSNESKMNDDKKIWIVLDPVMISTSGHRLIDPDTQQAMIEYVFPYVDIVTPNKYEAETLLGGRILNTPSDVEQAAVDILNLGVSSVLIKGGHSLTQQDQQFAQDYFVSTLDENNNNNLEQRVCDARCWMQLPRYDTEHIHGTGCTLSSSIAAALALGEQARRRRSSSEPYELRKLANNDESTSERGGGCWTSMDLLSACCLAKAYVTAGIERGVQIGQGPGPVRQTSFPNSYRHYPSLVVHPDKSNTMSVFRPMRSIHENLNYDNYANDHPTLGEILPIVDSVEWVERLCQTDSVTDIQLRIKNISGNIDVYELVRNAQNICSKYNVRLWINDYWEAAVIAKCFGVHLGQEDLYQCIREGGLERLQQSKMALGISTHSFSELAVAIALNPSYISLGPIFATGSKKVNFDPQGLATVRLWRQFIHPRVPLCVIGGIGDATTAANVREAGADCVAVIGAITQPTDTLQAVQKLSEAMMKV